MAWEVRVGSQGPGGGGGGLHDQFLFFFKLLKIFSFFFLPFFPLLIYFFISPTPRSMWDLGSPAPCIGRQSLNHWTAREVPLLASNCKQLNRDIVYIPQNPPI